MATIKEYTIPMDASMLVGDGSPETIEPHYNYTNQAWVIGGRYIDCSHPTSMDCSCYGRVHAGELEK